jgi:hypothetical protein
VAKLESSQNALVKKRTDSEFLQSIQIDDVGENQSNYQEEPSSTSKKTNWFTGMFQKEEPQKVETVQDWLKQETPKF